MDTRVRLIQCLCPLRHCIVGLAFEPLETTDAQAVEQIRQTINLMIESGAQTRECGLCGSTVWTLEIGQTRFATIEEATPHLRALEAANLRTRAFLHALMRHEP